MIDPEKKLDPSTLPESLKALMKSNDIIIGTPEFFGLLAELNAFDVEMASREYPLFEEFED